MSQEKTQWIFFWPSSRLGSLLKGGHNFSNLDTFSSSLQQKFKPGPYFVIEIVVLICTNLFGTRSWLPSYLIFQLKQHLLRLIRSKMVKISTRKISASKNSGKWRRRDHIWSHKSVEFKLRLWPPISIKIHNFLKIDHRWINFLP